MSQTPLQELESTIRQRRLYLQGQDNQIQRNQQRLNKQQQQLAENEAKIAEQQESYDRLTKDAETALKTLRKQAEATPSKRFLQLTKQCETLQQEVTVLDTQKKAILTTIADASSQLERLDMEIIEADGIYNELRQLIGEAKKKLARLNRRASVQAGIVTSLEYDVQQAEKRLRQARNLKTELEKQQTALADDMNRKQQELVRLLTDISTKRDELRVLNKNLAAVTKSLEALIDKEKTFRKGLAEEKQRLAQEEENIKLSRQELRRETEARQMVDPKWTPKPAEELKHFKL